MKRYQLIEDFGGMKKGDVIETAEISNMLAPIAIELQEPELVVGTEGEKDGENCSEQDQQDQQAKMSKSKSKSKSKIANLKTSQSASIPSEIKVNNGYNNPARGGAIHHQAGF